MHTYSIDQILAMRERYKDPPYPEFSLAEVCRKKSAQSGHKLVRSANAWEGHKPTSQDDFVTRLVNGALNKLAPEKYDCVMETLKHPILLQPETMPLTIQLIFQKALNEPGYSQTYARLCYDMAVFELHSQPQPTQAEAVDPSRRPRSQFRDLLITGAEREFRQQQEADVSGLTPEEADARITQITRRKRANIKFVGELFMQRAVAATLMHRIIEQILRDTPERVQDAQPGRAMPQEIDIEVLCQLLETVGKTLDVGNEGRQRMDTHFRRLRTLLTLGQQLPAGDPAAVAAVSPKTKGPAAGAASGAGAKGKAGASSPSAATTVAPTSPLSSGGFAAVTPIIPRFAPRVNFKIMDTLELRDNGWVPRVERSTALTPATLKEIAEKERQRELGGMADVARLTRGSPTTKTPGSGAGRQMPKSSGGERHSSFPETPPPAGWRAQSGPGTPAAKAGGEGAAAAAAPRPNAWGRTASGGPAGAGGLASGGGGGSGAGAGSSGMGPRSQSQGSVSPGPEGAGLSPSAPPPPLPLPKAGGGGGAGGSGDAKSGDGTLRQRALALAAEWAASGAAEPVRHWTARFQDTGLSDDALKEAVAREVVRDACLTSKADAQHDACEFLVKALGIGKVELLTAFGRLLEEAVREEIYEDAPRFFERFALVAETCAGDAAVDAYRDAATVIFFAFEQLSAAADADDADGDGVEDPSEHLIKVWRALPKDGVDASVVSAVLQSRGAGPASAALAVALLRQLDTAGVVAGGVREPVERWLRTPHGKQAGSLGALLRETFCPDAAAAATSDDGAK